MTTSDEPTPPPAEATPRSRWRLPLILALVALGLAAIAGGAGYLAWPRVQSWLQPAESGPAAPGPAELAGRIAALSRQLADTRTQVASLKARLDALAAAAPAPAASAPAPGQIAAAPSNWGARIDSLSQRLDQLGRNSVDPATVLHLSVRLDRAETTLRRLSAERTSAAALLLAVVQLREAVNRAAPYDPEWRAVSALAGPTGGDMAAGLAALKSGAAAGIPTRATLARHFLALEPALIRTDLVPSGAGWIARSLARLASIVSIRREDGDVAGHTVPAVAARVAARLAARDLAGAVTQADGFTGDAAKLIAPWLAGARARLAADAALSAMTAQAIADTTAQAAGVGAATGQ
jgi:hypothetical protein